MRRICSCRSLGFLFLCSLLAYGVLYMYIISGTIRKGKSEDTSSEEASPAAKDTKGMDVTACATCKPQHAVVHGNSNFAAGMDSVVTQACKHPHLEINNPLLMKFFKSTSQLDCGEEDWLVVEGNTVRITDNAQKKHGDINCSFTDLVRKDDWQTLEDVSSQYSAQYNLTHTDFVKVQCSGDKGASWENYMAGIRHDPDVLKRTGWKKVAPDGLGLNVLIWGFDSLSRLTFMRKLPKSYEYLTEQLGAIVLQGYNIVGDGTPQALIPILTGWTEQELPETRKRMDKASHCNVYPFVWKDFKASGYVTGFFEDSPSIGTFTYRLKGFKEPPTDHYMRPFYVAAEPSFSKSRAACQKGIPRHKVMMNYMQNLFLTYKDRPKFAFAFHNELSHDDYNKVGSADEDLMNMLETLRTHGALEDTLVIVMSDHGHRFAEIRDTQQGKQEERLPFFSFSFPTWFEQKHPTAMKNFRNNIHRLTTPFDIYSTLMDLIHFRGQGKGDLRNRSISLFQEIPLERTCENAFIEPHWCACLDWQEASVTDIRVKEAVDFFISTVNNYTEEQRDLCLPLKIQNIVHAAKLFPNKGLLKFNKNADLDGFEADMSANTMISHEIYQVKLHTVPGPGHFEASIMYDIKGDTFIMKMEDISRTNKYGKTAHCMESRNLDHLRKFCYCRKPPI